MDTRKQTILIVDDIPENIKVLSLMLGAEQELLSANSGGEALKIANERLPDLILLDIMMPDMDGYEVCARLKNESRTRSIPIIFITAKSEEEDEAKGLEIGAIDYISKPLSLAIVRARVRNHLELKRYQDLLEDLSFKDGLTGIANRRELDKHLQQEWRRAIRNQTPISLILMDIDFLKEFNDHYSHLAGDDCLRLIAHVLSECIRRPADLVSRYGGDEFACLLPETDINGAVWVANRIWEKVNNLNIPHAYSSAADHVTLSLGAATMIPEQKQVSTLLIQHADELLYKAKRNGRNQIRSSGEN